MDKKKLKMIWTDLETTGLDENNDSIIELASICGEDVFHRYCCPAEKPSNWDFISKLTGISWEFLVENGISDKELFKEYVSWLDRHVAKFDKEDKAVFGGYGARFDFSFIHELFERNGSKFAGSYFLSVPEDVQSFWARAVRTGKAPMLANNKLSTVCGYFNIPIKAHSALEDIQATIVLNDMIADILN